MNTLTDKAIDTLFPVGGSVGSGLAVLFSFDNNGVLMWITLTQMIDIVLTMAIGAVVGWFVKLGLDWCKMNGQKYKSKPKK